MAMSKIVCRWVRAAMLPAIFFLHSCAPPGTVDPESALTLVIAAEPSTKASDVTLHTWERQVNRLQILLFSDGRLARYESLLPSSFPCSRSYASLREGTYHAYAVANGPDLDGILYEDVFASTPVSLSDCSLDPSKGFVMVAADTVTLGGGTARTLSLPLRRLAARFRLASIENQVPDAYSDGGRVHILGVYLSNAPGAWNIAGSGSASGWVNLGGRAAGRHGSGQSEYFISSPSQVNPEACRDLVFRQLAISMAQGARRELDGCLLYCFPNSVAIDQTGPVKDAGRGAWTRLVLLAQVNDRLWWYPLTLFPDGQGPDPNLSYDIRLMLRATGSSDPNEPVGPGTLAAVLSCSGWQSGVSYTELL